MESFTPENRNPNCRPTRLYYTLKELTALRGAAQSPEDELRILLEALAGMQSEEAATFSPGMVDLSTGLIEIKSVTGWFREVPLQESLRRHIEMMRADGLLPYRRILECPLWSQQLSRLLDYAGIKPIPNGLRNGYAVHREAQGVHPCIVGMEIGNFRSSILGNSPVKATPLVSAETARLWFSE